MPAPTWPNRRAARTRGPRAAVAVAAAAVLLALAAVPARGAKLAEGQKAASFKGVDFLTNTEVDLERVLGKRPVLIDFGSIYCSSCMVTVPNLIKLRKKYAEEDLAILNIYLDIYNPQRVIKFFRGFAKDIRLSLLIDDKLAISREYGIDTLPTTVIIDRRGVIRKRIVGYTEADEKEIDSLVDTLVRELPSAGEAVAEAGREEPFNVIVPESFTKTLQEHIFVVGYVGGSGAKSVSLKLNNLPEKTAPAKENVFHFLTPLSLAMNLLEVKGEVGDGKVQSQSLVIFRETRAGSDITSELPAYKFHRDEEKKPCAKCHKVEVDLQGKSAMQQSEVCAACHTNLGKVIFTHGPITVGGCLPCHDAQSFPNRYELRHQGAELCYTCHDKIKELLSTRPYIHGPAAAGVCVVCHMPHGSNEKFFLARKTEKLCITCHQDFLKEFTNPVVHRPVEEGNCTGCHDPHAAPASKLLVLPREGLCGKCHELASSHMHKVGVGAATEFPQGTPLSGEGTTTCYTCHMFHSSSNPKLARGTKQECGRGCHDAEAGEDGERGRE